MNCRAAVRVSIACVVVLLQPACSSSAKQPQLPQGELKLIWGPHPDDTTLVHTDGSFELVFPQQTSLRHCGGICPRSIERFAVHGDTIMKGSHEVMRRAADGHVDMGGLGQVTIDDDGVLVQSGQRRALDASGRLLHLDSDPDGTPDVTVVGATTPELRRRAMLVLAFVNLAYLAAAIDRASH